MSVEGSQGSTGRYRPTNSNDPGWDNGQPVDGNRDHAKYDFCGHVSKGGIRRLKQHLVKASYKGTMYKDVRKCDKVPQDVVDVLRSFMEGKQKITEEKQSKKDEMIRNVNVYGNDDDEVEEVEIQIPKKRKGPMDAFVAPIDVDFCPRAPNSSENKKALENIHGYIADSFYENSISFNCARSDSYSKMMQTIVNTMIHRIERILDRRRSGMLQKPLHAVAHYLNPQYYYATLTSSDEMESNTKLKEGLLDCIAKLALDEEDESQILRDLIVYRTKVGRLGKRGAQACVKTIVPG
ncbi:hypothetical protein GIB67_023857 [Kingdonia uniflora]|uniref:Uncharacterized protein n=1 Tax=Kingdonia uniflora TaxID=39325 RepID=A0A7J7NG57_9MAGN|nr:hypothetical protein GIB67_023857 [Kingdonia uniflora]